MRTPFRYYIAFVAVCLGLMAPLPAGAEKYTDIYLGVAVPSDQDVRITGEVSGPDVDTTIKEQFDPSFVAGARFGAWFLESPTRSGWIGFGIDLAYYKLLPETIDVEIAVVPIVATLMFRYPGKHFQPYLGAGFGLFIGDADGNLSDFGLTSNFDSISVDLGWGARAGFAFPLHKKVALFLEYRLDGFRQDHTDDHLWDEDTLEYDAVVHHGLVGISLRF
jgi:hypothetical protein